MDEDSVAAHAELMQDPTLLPALASQYSDCAGQSDVMVAVADVKALERQV